jgi:hypothetical protein
LSDTVNVHIVKSTEATILAAESNDNPAKQVAITGFASETIYTNYVMV